MDMMIDIMSHIHEESPTYGGYVFEIEKAKDFLEHFLSEPDEYCIFIHKEGGGMIVGQCAAQWFTSEKEAFDLFIYVKPDYRKGRAAVRLIQAYEKWADKMGAKRTGIGTTSGINIESTDRLYRSMNYKKYGYLYYKGGV